MTDIKLFLKNYRLLKSGNTEYISDNWIKKGHNGNLFTNKAMTEGMKGWHFMGSHRKYYEPLKLHQFLYTGYEGETK